ncbi:HPF/RaiA family ribosome-associated protein [Gemmata sp. JC673]|uniref:HPF/RaiA family ribosome-associated protein n=1 Tax=Gemmata algarum TaxID=2975278 RepID=A0ABU5F7X5_9BACT|nr:HPF/RaiA family ribosome-associated protein [Gemmata algarum]MDY3563703.1 HPF/RaiA family ribosome-associated protein [Gemmata algarum]
MLVEISTDTRVSVDISDVTAKLASALSRYQSRLTRVEAHLSDVNGPKSGPDARCTLEARAAGLQPVAVTSDAHTPDEAVKGAVEKMDRLLESALDRLNDANRHASASGLPT